MWTGTRQATTLFKMSHRILSPLSHAMQMAESERFDYVLRCELHEHYSCSYYITQLLIIREGLPDLITSS